MVGQLASAGAQHDAVRGWVVLAVPCVLAVEQVKRILERLNLPGQGFVLLERGLHAAQCSYNFPQIGRA